MMNHRKTHTYTNTRLTHSTPRRIVVDELEAVVLIRRGAIERVLPTGVHRLRPRIDRILRFPRQEQILLIRGQETLTGDGATVRATVAATYRIDDALLVARVGPFVETIHLRVQLALRNVLAEYELEQLLAERAELDSRVAEKAIEAVGTDLGISITGVAIRDLIVPGPLRAAVAEVVAARLAGQATLERARGETAALRSMANAARMAQDNPALLQIRMLQAAEQGNHTFVFGSDLRGSVAPAPTNQ